jgi:hypothetical protein
MEHAEWYCINSAFDERGWMLQFQLAVGVVSTRTVLAQSRWLLACIFYTVWYLVLRLFH